MNETQYFRNCMAEIGYELTPKEADKIIQAADELANLLDNWTEAERDEFFDREFYDDEASRDIIRYYFERKR